MEAVGAKYCVFNCPACFFTMKGMAAERGMTPILLSDLCQIALGEVNGMVIPMEGDIRRTREDRRA